MIEREREKERDRERKRERERERKRERERDGRMPREILICQSELANAAPTITYSTFIVASYKTTIVQLFGQANLYLIQPRLYHAVITDLQTCKSPTCYTKKNVHYIFWPI
jgi:hypothetical protein